MNLLKVPEDLPDEKLLLLSDVIPTGWHGNELAQVDESSAVAVWGAGPVGAMTAYLARQIRKAPHVISIDHNPFRLDKVAKHGGVDTINFDQIKDVVKAQKHAQAPLRTRCMAACKRMLAVWDARPCINRTPSLETHGVAVCASPPPCPPHPR